MQKSTASARSVATARPRSGLRRVARPGAGRPTRDQARERHEQLLASALDQFLDRGFERATIEAIAASVGMTKRTVYARYPDKSALFLATVRRAIEQLQVPEEKLRALDGADLESALLGLARLRVENVMTPTGLKLQRIINTESYRFPQIFTMSYEQGARPTVEFLAARLRRETAAGTLAITDPLLAANVFMSMVVGGPVRFIVSGQPLAPAAAEARMRFAVRLFLDGARARPGAP